MTNGEDTRVALWTNHLNHWIIGYERDALAGYDSGFFYTVPETEAQKDCPHMDQMVWKKWITHWRRWGDVDPAFSVRCLGKVLVVDIDFFRRGKCESYSRAPDYRHSLTKFRRNVVYDAKTYVNLLFCINLFYAKARQ